MPTVVNGIGTWYYGKRRIHTRKGTCEFCGNLAVLSSHDTTLFFVIFFVPVFPLARKRILEQCAICQRHRVLPLAKWEDAKVRDGAVVIEQLRTDPDNRDSLLHALGFVQAYQDEPLFNEIVEPLAGEHTDDAAIQSQLAETYAYFARWPKAEEAFRAALAVEDSELVRERLAWALLKQGRPQEARALLQHILAGKRQESAGLIYFLIKGYQAEGLHDAALTLMDERDRAFPELVNIKEYQKQRKVSTRYRGTEKKVRSSFLDEEGKTGYRQGGWTARLPGLIAALLLLGVVGFYLGSAIWIGHARKVFLVNGTGKPYTVAVAGSEHTLPPRSATPIRLSEGDVEVAFPQAKAGLEPIHCRIETSFWSRPFAGHTFVINPDQTALVIEEETVYAQMAPPPGKPPQYHLGQALYSFSGMDYEFQEFPATLQVSRGGTLTKTRVALGPSLDPVAQLAAIVFQLKDHDQQIAVCKRALLFDPGNSVFLYWLTHQLQAEPMIDFLKSHLEDRPPLVEWHRAYQTVMEKAHPDTDLRPRYQQLVAETKEQPDAVYLLGRLQPEWETAKKLFLQAAAGSPPSGFAMYAMAHHALAAAEFADAVRWSEKALVNLSDKTIARHVFHDALLANKDYDRLLGLLQNETQAAGMRFNALNEMCRIHAIRGDRAKTQEVLDQLVKLSPLNQQQKPQAMLEAMVCCCENDRAGFLKRTSTDAAGPYAFESAFLQGRLEDAGKLASASLDAGTCHALVYLAASRAKARQLALVHWKAVLADLSKQGRDGRLLADVLTGKKAPERILQRITIEPRKKRVYLILLAERHPDMAREMLDLARKLDFYRDAVSLCLSQILAAPPKQ